ncbi:MAG TPA: DedA family protein [Candidatus Dormibacteraeota bacterium]|nr:DedA family protein [Candidatus Dormibacteraeota bacterium]
MTSAVTNFVQNHGILAVFILMAAESCGIPFPSELIMPFAGFMASQGHISLTGAIFAGAFGNLVGSLIAYWLAAQFGTALLLGPGRWIGISRSHIELADRWFKRHGLLAVLVGRVLPVIRTYISFPAGLARVDPLRFSVLTFVGALPWCAALAAGGYAIGASYDNIVGPITKAAIVIAVLVVIGLVVWFMRGRRTRAAAAGAE